METSPAFSFVGHTLPAVLHRLGRSEDPGQRRDALREPCRMQAGLPGRLRLEQRRADRACRL
eukprot:7124914-Pyramimonas_sp.AAC.1